MLGLILKRSALLMTGTVGSAVLSFAQSIFLTRALTPDLVGVWAIGGSVAMVVFGLLGFRSIDAVNRSLALLPEGCRDLRGAVITSALAAEFAAASVCLALLLAGSSWLMPHLSSSADAVAITLLQAVSIFFLWMDRPFQALCRTTGSYRRITQIALMSGTVKLLATMGLFALGELTLMRFGYLQVAISALTFMAHGASMNQFMARNLSIGFSDLSIATAWRHRRNLNCFWNLMIASFWSSCCSSVFKQIDVILLGAWRGDADAGLYRVAKSLATLAQTVGSTLAFSIFTEFNDLLSRRAYDELRHEIGRTVRLLLPMAVVLNLGGIALHWLIPFIYGPQLCRLGIAPSDATPWRNIRVSTFLGLSPVSRTGRRMDLSDHDDRRHHYPVQPILSPAA